MHSGHTAWPLGHPGEIREELKPKQRDRCEENKGGGRGHRRRGWGEDRGGGVRGGGAGRAEKAERNRSAQWGLERRSERGRTPPGWSGVGKLREGRVPRSGGRRVAPLYKRVHFPGTEDIANYVHVSSSP